MDALYFDDIEVGHEMKTGPYLLSKDEVIAFATRFDPRPIHIDEAAAARSIFEGLTAASAHTFAIAQALSWRWTPPLAVTAAMGIDEMRFPAPARPGDELWFTSTLIEKRESKSRPDQGVVRYQTFVRTGAGDVVLDYKITVLVARRKGPL